MTMLTCARFAPLMPLLVLAMLLAVSIPGTGHSAPGSAAPAAGAAPTAGAAMSEVLASRPRVALASHEIVYDIRLKDVRERSGVAMASGKLFSRLLGAPCEGWTSTSRMKVRFVFERRGVRETESRVTSWEADDGNQYHSHIERRLNGRRTETIRVSVFRQRAGEPFTLRMTEPDQRTITLPAATLFPTAALKRLVQAARRGERNLSLLIYEGDREAAPQRVVAIIGKRQPGSLRPAASADGEATPPLASGDDKPEDALTWLRSMPYWPVSLAYYGVENAVEEATGNRRAETDRKTEERRFGLPEYEVHFHLYDNGVAGEALLIYPDYVLKAEVTGLRLLPAPACE